MTDNPDFLPSILNLSGSWEHILNLLYSVFTKDFKDESVYHYSIRVIYNNKILPDGHGKEEGFWHVISKVDMETKERIIDFRRAERLPWARPIMESPKRAEIKLFDYDHGLTRKSIRRYIWLEEYDYVVILQRKRNVYFWVTAYYVDSKGRRVDLNRRYKKRL
jgi:hypothetical protein